MCFKYILTVFVLLFIVCPSSAWVSGYDYRMPIEINNTGNDLTDFQYNFTVDTAALVAAGKMQANGSDCCITDSSDVLQSFWNETPFNLSDTKIWVNASYLGNVSNTTHYIYYGDINASLLIDGDATFELFDDFEEGSEDYERIEQASLWSESAPDDWVGRPCLENYTNDNVWISTYVTSETLTSASTCELHIRFSTNEGVTWTNPDTYTNGTAIDGFPVTGHNSYGVGEALLIIAPNGDLIVLGVELNSFTFGSADMNGIWQYRSINGGANWTDEGKMFLNSTLNVVDYTIVGTDIYITAENDSTESYSYPVNSMLYKSTNNATSWSFVSNITEVTDNPPCNSFPETGIEYCGNNTFITVIRGRETYSKTYQRLSTDLGLTWGTLEDITSQVGVVSGRPQLKIYPNEPNRIYLYGRNTESSPEYPSMSYTDNNGTLWSSPFSLNTPSCDISYVSVLKRSNGTYYALYSCGPGGGAEADIWRSTYQISADVSPDLNKWSISGSPIIVNGTVVLDNDDAIKSISTFGFETIATSKSKANEQDISFIGYYTDTSNRMQLQNSDGISDNDFDNIMFINYKDGAQQSPFIQNDGWSDFRNTYYQYTIKRISTSSIKYSQGVNSNSYTNPTYIPIGNMPVQLYVWDSSQESILTSDWIFVREYVDVEPITSFGAEESAAVGAETITVVIL